MKQQQMYKLKISIRQLVEYVFRSGHIIQGWQNPQALSEGTKNHQKVQAMQGDSYLKEVHLQQTLHIDEHELTLEGRCDGIFPGEPPTIDEIKSTYKPLEDITDNDFPSYWAQLKCYGYLFCLEHQIDFIQLQMTYIHIITGECKSIKQSVSVTALEAFVNKLLVQYMPFALSRLDWPAQRNQSIQTLAFPFPQFREGQRGLAKHVYHAIREEIRCFVKAPTGIGKTISTLFPALKAIGEGHLERIFFLTAKTVTRRVAEDTLHHMVRAGLKIKSVTLTAKEKACLQDEVNCHPTFCSFADGYYDRINVAITKILEQEDIMTCEVIERYAQLYQLCPFELSLDLALFADVIICDYNYIFDPKASLKRIGDDLKKNAILLIDEAHNLVDRARMMFSTQIEKSPILEVQRYFKGTDAELYNISKKLNDFFIQLRKTYLSQDPQLLADLPEELLELIKEALGLLDRWLEQNKQNVQRESIVDLYYSLYHFMRVAKLYTEHFITCIYATKQEVTLEIRCLDPAHLLREMTQKFKASIFFSATLFPLNYYKECLGGTAEDISLQLSSPFPPENLEITIHPISTRYKDRERTLLPIAKLIQQQLKGRKENVLIFAPSYTYLQQLISNLEVLEEEYHLLIQQTAMSEQERASFIAAYEAEREKPVLGISVMGGIFSEGIDLPGDRLSCVIIIGTGIPQIGFERELLREHYQQNEKNGYDYAYLYPGMSKVLQAAGRLIRTEHDQGRLILIDDRYLTPVYQRLMPQEWRHFKVSK